MLSPPKRVSTTPGLRPEPIACNSREASLDKGKVQIHSAKSRQATLAQKKDPRTNKFLEYSKEKFGQFNLIFPFSKVGAELKASVL